MFQGTAFSKLFRTATKRSQTPAADIGNTTTLANLDVVDEVPMPPVESPTKHNENSPKHDETPNVSKEHKTAKSKHFFNASKKAGARSVVSTRDVKIEIEPATHAQRPFQWSALWTKLRHPKGVFATFEVPADCYPESANMPFSPKQIWFIRTTLRTAFILAFLTLAVFWTYASSDHIVSSARIESKLDVSVNETGTRLGMMQSNLLALASAMQTQLQAHSQLQDLKAQQMAERVAALEIVVMNFVKGGGHS